MRWLSDDVGQGMPARRRVHMNKNGLLTLVFGVAVLVVCTWVLLGPFLVEPRMAASGVQTLPAPAALPAVTSSPVAATSAEFLQWAQRGAALGEPPRSLQGTTVDGGVGVDGGASVDAQGNLVIAESLRRLFDYFLATAGEETPEQIRARIAFYLQQQLPLDAAMQGWAILGQYLAYKDALADLSGHDGSYDGMLASLREQRDLRDTLLGPTLSSAFFQAEDEYADFALQHVTQLRDSNLSAEEKERLTQELLATLPEESRREIEATGAPVRVEQQVEMLRQQGASEADVWQVREQQFGSAAAGRLAQLDQTRAEWEQRYGDYRQQLQQIETSALAEAERQEAVARLRAITFSEQEMKRVEALDRIGAAQASVGTED